MTPTSVGMRCPECAREKTKVRKLRTPRTSGGVTVTQVLIGINVFVFLLETAAGAPLVGGGGGTVWEHGVLFGPAVAAQGPYHTHEVWRLVTAGFLHDGLLHILFNMWFLFIIGPMLEPAIGKLNFTVVYFVSLLSGSFGALLFQPLSPTVGASTACFGLLGALIVVAYYRGISIWQSGLGLTLVINIIFTLSVSGISLGGHLGGLVGGAICGWLIVQLGERRNMEWAALTGCALVAIISIVGALAVAGSHGLTPNGVGF
jgi:membrane associated rhomboid family serine protease